jgi:hypothetical protein
MANLGAVGRIILKWILKKQDIDVVWIDLAHDRDKWRALVNTVMTLLSSIKCGEFLD